MNKKIKFLFAGLILALGLVGFTIFTGIDVPAKVKSSFNKKYPTAQKVEWDLEEEGVFEAEFKMAGQEMSANFNELGEWLETEIDIKKSTLPDVITKGILRDFKDYKIKGIETIEKPNTEKLYEIELINKKMKTSYDVVYSKNGLMVKKEVSNDDEDKDNDDD